MVVFHVVHVFHVDCVCKAWLYVNKRIVIKSQSARDKPLLSKVSIKHTVQKANAVVIHLS